MSVRSKQVQILCCLSDLWEIFQRIHTTVLKNCSPAVSPWQQHSHMVCHQGLEIPSLWPWWCIHKIGERIQLFPSFKITMFKHKIFIFSFSSSPIFKERCGFRFFINRIYISCNIPLGLCVSIDIYISEYGYLIFWWNCCVIFGGFAVIHCFACTMRSCNTHTLSLSWL